MKKCKDCGTEVPPTFAQALMDNRCPACGKPIMSGIEFAELRQVRATLAGLHLDERLTITIAAAISSKFDLVPKGSALTVQAATAATQPEPAPEDDMAGLTEEQKTRERALRAAQRQREEDEEKQAIAEWGLDKVANQVGAKKAQTQGLKLPMPPPEFVELFGELPVVGEVPDEAFLSGGNPMKAADRMARLAKLEANRNDGSKFKVRRD